ncbi:MAG: histone-like protein [Nanoarchaeota archaeon]
MTEENKPKNDEIDDKLAFPEASIVRIMKKHLDNEKMIKKEVKVAMNKWLEKVCANVAKEMNKVPYVMMNLHEFKEGTRVYDILEDFDHEKKRILAHMAAMKMDIEKLERDLGKVEDATDEQPN